MAPTAELEPGGLFDRAEAARPHPGAGRRAPSSPSLLDQKVVAGVGNIYASEGLFLAGVDPPARPAQSVTDAELDALWDAVHPMMWDGTTRWGRTKTTPARAAGAGPQPVGVPAEGEAVPRVRDAGRARAAPAVRPGDPTSARPASAEGAAAGAGRAGRRRPRRGRRGGAGRRRGATRRAGVVSARDAGPADTLLRPARAPWGQEGYSPIIRSGFRRL